MCDDAAESSSVANNSVCNALLDSSVPVVPAAYNNESTITPPAAISALTLVTSPSLTRSPCHSPSPTLSSTSHSHCRPSSPSPTVAIDVCNEVAESTSVATKSTSTARTDLSVSIALADCNDTNTTSTPPHSTSTPNSVTLITPPSTTQPLPEPTPLPHSHSHSSTSTIPPAVATDVCNEVVEPATVATNSLLYAYPGLAAPTASNNNNNNNTDSTAHTAHTTHTTHTAHTAHAPSNSHDKNNSTRPPTRSTTAPIHPFYSDLTNRTGKAAKHFRRLYSPTAAICECGLFPVYSQQLRSSTAPAIVLPTPFQRLCLDCIGEIHMHYTNPLTCGTPCWARSRVPGLEEAFWSQSMSDTYMACYQGYYTDKYKVETQRAAPSTDFRRAVHWLADRGNQYKAALGDMKAEVRGTTTVIVEDDSKRLAEEQEGEVEEEEKEAVTQAIA